jgi:hypothetical protein
VFYVRLYIRPCFLSTSSSGKKVANLFHFLGAVEKRCNQGKNSTTVPCRGLNSKSIPVLNFLPKTFSYGNYWNTRTNSTQETAFKR